ncbi:asparagine synthase (glutamine-hydrolyzing) [bacterium]|nr:asparagine synthase (glutamine-hydrolyzing) [bacterium]
MKKADTELSPAIIQNMTDLVSHRGPDDQDVRFYTLDANGDHSVSDHANSPWTVALGHRRLSILDLSEAGRQPMQYRKNLWMIFNGEVYNFVELREELEKLGHEFHTGTDTEVILAAYDQWGTDCFARFHGMWGIIILDVLKKEIILCRDRMGIKPLYWWKRGDILAITSEIKQFLEVPGFEASIDINTAREFLLTGYEEPRQSFFQGVHPVPAGTFLSISLNSLIPSEPVSYWNPEQITPAIFDPKEAGREFVREFRNSVRFHLRSDVPVGCALSGGLDSSSIAVMVDDIQRDKGKLHTFSSVFPGDPIDESEYIDAVSAQITSSPHAVTPSSSQFMADMNDLIWAMDEPFPSFSMYASYEVARLTRGNGVPVTLNGQGGDELFTGYWQSYFLHLYRQFQQGHYFNVLGNFVGAMLPSGNSEMIRQTPIMYKRYRTRSNPSSTAPLLQMPEATGQNPLQKIMKMDDQARRVYEVRELHLPRLLKWDDRISMNFSVEGRYPFLDHKVIELCLSFHPSVLYTRGWVKLPLRLGMSHRLPKKVIQRRTKFGFLTPMERWMSGPLAPMLKEWSNQDHAVWQLVDKNKTQKLTESMKIPGANQIHNCETLFRIFLFDRWMERFGVALS